MGKTELPTTRKTQKWKKQGFQLLGKLKNGENRASNYSESSKMEKTKLPTTWKAQKWKKQSFQLLGKFLHQEKRRYTAFGISSFRSMLIEEEIISLAVRVERSE